MDRITTVQPLEFREIELVRKLRMDPGVAKWLFSPSVPITPDAQERWYKAMCEDETRHVFAGHSRGRFIGYCQIGDIDVFHRIAETGIAIEPQAQAQGHGAIMMQWLLGFAFVPLCLEKVYLHTFADNERARRLFRSVGFVSEGVLRGHYLKEGKRRDVIVMSILQEHYNAVR